MGVFFRLTEYKSQQAKEEAFLLAATKKNKDFFFSSGSRFAEMPGCPVAYWVSDAFITCFHQSLLAETQYPKTGFTTGDNDKFLRLWYEVDFCQKGHKWFPMNKGGEARKWYGNNEYFVNWEDDGYDIKHSKGCTIRNPEFYFREGVSWSKLAKGFGGRLSTSDFLFDAVGLTCFSNDSTLIYYILALFCSKVAKHFLDVLNPTLSFTTGAVANLPFIVDETQKNDINCMAKKNAATSKDDWDSFETSWDFKRHPLI